MNDTSYSASRPASTTANAAPSWSAQDLVAAISLFLATAAVVLWQVHRVGILWDLSYILDSAWRISLGQVPYRDLPFAHAPLTFLVQAAIIKLLGRNYMHHALYAAIAAGLGTVLTWRIVLRILNDRAVALLLAASVTVLSVYSILPIPFYDCDCALSILLALYLLQRLDARAYAGQTMAVGAALVLPVFFKQNIGLPFLLTALVGIGAVVAVRRITRAKPGPDDLPTVSLLLVIAGAAATLALCGLILQFTAGIGNYYRWTVQFAAQRRMPGLRDMLAVYTEPSLRWTLPCIVLALLFAHLPTPRNPGRSDGVWRDPENSLLARVAPGLAMVLMTLPFLATLLSLFQSADADDRASSLLALWPLLLILSSVHALYGLVRRRSLHALLPLLALAAIHGTMLSQQLWGSTYALWPLLIYLLAGMIAGLPAAVPKIPLAAVVGVTLIVCGLPYIASEERLSYSNVLEGPVNRSTLPELQGLSVHGPWLPAFDQLVRFTDAEIPQDDGILLLNGEDPFFFATGRTPQFPILLFDPATDPYAPEQTVTEVRENGIHWLIVKRRLQIKADPMPDRDRTLDLLRKEFAPYRQLDNYDIYRRTPTLAPVR
ncbi:Dolichyl-phosphate-mannose-protein mannosyltransferase [Granulicella rosea]|uniref:Dolichyl-phosphate-mannose-protein mannosyltransferase n=1 Tax=Granulicella rosea TaxID=474952 RepID=A0A239E798_9BACT|nr:hypothetical protein [Granulicella rosea]SNS39802.1 Dolichyl-phosphate-mannose-protein mannosyltransferase [Granulicella rosea]